MDKYISRKELVKTLGIHYQTVYNMIDRGDIETIKVGKKNMYNLDKYLRDQGVESKKIANRRNICYCRVSSAKQKDDLERQIESMRNKYPHHDFVTDIGSGLNYNRIGLQKILKIAISGELNELVIAYKDRLVRFGFEMIDNIVKEYSNGTIIILNSSEEKTPLEEISEDILSIMNIYVAKINGLRKYKKEIKKELLMKK
jgi:putative resolvase